MKYIVSYWDKTRNEYRVEYCDCKKRALSHAEYHLERPGFYDYVCVAKIKKKWNNHNKKGWFNEITGKYNFFTNRDEIEQELRDFVKRIFKK